MSELEDEVAGHELAAATWQQLPEATRRLLSSYVEQPVTGRGRRGRAKEVTRALAMGEAGVNEWLGFFSGGSAAAAFNSQNVPPPAGP